MAPGPRVRNKRPHEPDTAYLTLRSKHGLIQVCDWPKGKSNRGTLVAWLLGSYFGKEGSKHGTSNVEKLYPLLIVHLDCSGQSGGTILSDFFFFFVGPKLIKQLAQLRHKAKQLLQTSLP